jgi:hypothetical protein
MYTVNLPFDPITFDEYRSYEFPSFDDGVLVLLAMSKDTTRASEYQYDFIGIKFFKSLKVFNLIYEQLKPKIVLIARRNFSTIEDGLKLEEQVKAHLNIIFSESNSTWNSFFENT